MVLLRGGEICCWPFNRFFCLYVSVTRGEDVGKEGGGFDQRKVPCPHSVLSIVHITLSFKLLWKSLMNLQRSCVNLCPFVLRGSVLTNRLKISQRAKSWISNNTKDLLDRKQLAFKQEHLNTVREI